jgi:hypothetical protein
MQKKISRFDQSMRLYFKKRDKSALKLNVQILITNLRRLLRISLIWNWK